MSSMPQHARPSSSSSLQQYQHQHQQHQQQSSDKKPGLLPPHSPCRLSSEAYRGKIDWEAKYRKPCPYARPAGEGCPYIRRSPKTCFSEHINSSSSGDDAQPPAGSLSRGLLVSVPGAPHRDFGSRFSREIDDPACRESTPDVWCEPERGAMGGATAGSSRREAAAARPPAAAAAATAAASSPKRCKNVNKNSGRSIKKSGGKRRVPTLLKIHQRVIEDALLELTRSRDKPFENLGERLGGEHEDFTFYDGTFNFAAGLPARLPACAAQRRKFARNRRKLHQRMRGQPNTIKGARHRAQTDHAYKVTPLPRFKKDQESWKIPLLRVPTPTNGERQEFISATTFGKIVSLGAHPQQASSSVAPGQSQNYPGRYSASCPPRKVRKDASGGRKHPRTVEGSGNHGRGGGGSRSDVENEPFERELVDGRPSDTALPAGEIIGSDQQGSLQTTAREEISGQEKHEEHYGNNAEEISAPCIEVGGPRDTTQSSNRAIAAGVTAATTTDAHAETVAWSGGAPPAVGMSGSERQRAEKCVDEIVSQGMQTHLAAASSGTASTSGSRTLLTSAETNDARSAEAVIASLEVNASAEKYVDEILSPYLLRTQPVSGLTTETITRSRPEEAVAGPERCAAIQRDAAVVSEVQHGDMAGATEGHCVNQEISQANQAQQAVPKNTSRICAAATDAGDGGIGLDSGAVGSGHLSIVEAKRFVEDVVSDVLQVHLHAAFDEEAQHPSPSTEVERERGRSKLTTTVGVVQLSVLEQVVNDALRQSLHAAVVAALGEQCSEPSTADAGLDEPPARLAEAISKRSEGDATAAMKSSASDEEKMIAGETDTRTPTTMPSNDISSEELFLNREPSAGIFPHLNRNIVHDGHIINDDDATVAAPTLTSPGHPLDGAYASVEAANPADTLPPSAVSATSEGGVGLGEEERREKPNVDTGVAAKGLPVGFLDAIVAGRASLKPAKVTYRRTPVKPSPSELRLQKESIEAEVKQRSAVLCEFEDLVRTERLDRYPPESFSRGAVLGEGKQSVVYHADVISRADASQRGGEEQGQDSHHAGAVVGGGVVAVATAAMADIVTTAAVGAITTATTTASGVTVEPASKTLAAGVVISVMVASVSSVAARKSREHRNARITSFAAKEFRYARQDAPVSILRDARREVCAHLRVAGCARVVALRGVWLTPRVTLLLEPMDVGNLHDFIRHQKSEETRRGADLGHGDGLTPAGAAWLLSEVADGLAVLHEAGVVHRDVKSHNVMMVLRRQPPPVDDDDDDLVGHPNKCEKLMENTPRGMSGWEAKLGDLGSAALVPSQERTDLTEEAGTSGWVAPEVFGGEGCGTAADIFSLGVLIWETFTRGALDNPLSGLSGQACRTKLRAGLRPPWPPQADTDVKGLVERCWAFEARDRPRAGAVADELRAYAAAAAAAAASQPLAST